MEIISYLVLSGLLCLALLFGIILNAHAYLRIRHLGYRRLTTALLVIGVDAVAVIASIVLLLASEYWWGAVGYIPAVIFVAFGCAVVALGSAVLVRALPKRGSIRVSGPRRARVPFNSLGYLTIAVGIVAALTVFYLFVGIAADAFHVAVITFMTLCCFTVWGWLLIVTGDSVRNQRTIEGEIKADPRLPVLYLRSFAAEAAPFFMKKHMGHRAAGVEAITFENYSGGEIRRIGPFVALGGPEDYMPASGSDIVRTYADDEGWYAYFEQLAVQVACIVMQVSCSDNLQRELTFVRRAGLQSRLFIITGLYIDFSKENVTKIDSKLVSFLWMLSSRLCGPPPPGFGEALPTWKQFAESLGKLGFELGDYPGRGSVVTFDSGGKAMVLVRGAEAPHGFVDPIRAYLMQTFCLNLDRVAAGGEAKTAK
jgi:hypothetical protein